MTVKPSTPETSLPADNSTEGQPALSADQVAEYLSNHRDFFENQRDLLLSLRLPHEQKNSVSLFEKQASLMRDREARHHRQIKTLISNARRNDQLLNHTRDLMIRLLNADTMAQVIETTQSCFLDQFGMDFATISTLNDTETDQQDIVKGLTNARKPVLGTLRTEELEYLFADNASQIGSAAVYCLRDENLDDGQEWGLLALASKDPNYFEHDMDSLFLEFVGDILVQLFGKYSGQ
ncbi:MAG: DUF484 family protein [Pseudomonadales bacterium]|nr:DUF484 family protein [Pseudomonadales bacterium]